jgi:hypothetical protein
MRVGLFPLVIWAVLLPAGPGGRVPAQEPAKEAGGKRLVIVAPKAYERALAAFVAHKKKLLPTELVALETALKASAGRDDAEKLKRYLYDQWKNHDLGYVLLVGDGTALPVRYFACNNGDPKICLYGFAPADLYYADLARRDGSFDDWNGARDGPHADYYGTMMQRDTDTVALNYDRLDYRPEVAVGRWPVRSSDEVAAVAAKSIRYESAVLGDDPIPVRRAGFVCRTNLEDFRGEMNDLAAGLEAKTGCLSVKLYSDSADAKWFTPAPTEGAVEAMFQRGVGLVFHSGHGDPGSWEGCLDGRRLRFLNDAALPPVVFSIGCDTAVYTARGPGRPYRDVHGKNHMGTDKGEVFGEFPPPPAVYQPREFADTGLGIEMLRNPRIGAAAYIGCAVGANSRAWPLMPAFIRYVTDTPEPRLGDAWVAAVNGYYKAYDLDRALKPGFRDGAAFDQGMLFHVFGDPSLRLPRSPNTKRNLTPIDLQPWANQRLTDSLGTDGNTLAELKPGDHPFAGITFTVGKAFIQLGGKSVTGHPLKVTGIKVDAKVKRIYFAHATGAGVKPGTVIGSYTMNYDDKRSVTQPIVYGRDLLDYWYAPDSDTPTGAMVCWTGGNPIAAKEGRRLRLYWTNWTNPRPDAAVRTIDFASANTDCAPFCVGMTAER